jgi:hypothetical protein
MQPFNNATIQPSNHMHWYTAKIVFQIICGEGIHHAQFDEQLRLIQAADGQEALAKARAIGADEQDRFLNQQKEWVQWRFVGVPEITRIGELRDGTELHYRITEPDSPENYIERVHQQTFSLQSL